MRRTVTPRNSLITPRWYRKPIRPVLDPNHPLSRGLLGYWPLGDSTTRADDLVSNNVCTAANGPLALAGAPRGGLSTTFNGSNQALTGTVTYSFRSWSVSAWAYSTSGSGGLGIFGQSDTGNNDPCRVFNTGLQFTPTTSSFSTLAVTAPSLNAWHHIVAILDFSTGGSPFASYYIDGVLANSGTLAGGGAITNNIGTVGIGRLGGFSGGNFWAGNIENVRFYDRPLSAAEALALYAEPYAGTFDAIALRSPGSFAAVITGTGVLGLSGISFNAAGGRKETGTANLALQGVAFNGSGSVIHVTGAGNMALRGVSISASGFDAGAPGGLRQFWTC